MAKIDLRLLGGFQARLGPGSAFVLPAKAQAVLAYLALRPGSAQPRDKIAALLWGATSDAQARANLRHTVFVLRKTLGETVLQTEGHTLAIEANAVDVDVATFERLIDAGTPDALERAGELYEGDLLDGLVLAEPAFEEWLLAERERLRELAVEALTKLLAHQMREPATERAIQTAMRLLALEPLQDAVHRTLMRLYDRQGRRAAALKQYQICVSVLQRELGAEPEAQTKQLYQEILQHRSAGARTAGTPRADVASHDDDAGVETSRRTRKPMTDVAIEVMPLIGRDGELAQLRDALHEAAQERGRVVMVTGDAGIGKTSVVDAMAAEARRGGARVVLGRSYESEHILSFGPWVDALRNAAIATDTATLAALDPTSRAELTRLLPEASVAGLPVASGDIRRLFESVANLLVRLATVEPVLVILEDVHWADELSLRLLAFLTRRLRSDAVMFLVTARDDEPAASTSLAPMLEELRREPTFVTVTLPPLGERDTFALVRALARTGIEPETVANRSGRIWVASHGNPFVIAECVRAVEQGAEPESGTLGLPAPVRQLIGGRLDRLGEGAALLVSVAAVIGREFDFDLLRHAAGVDERDASHGLEELVRRHILHGVGERFDFIHDRVRQVAYRRLLAPKRRVVHAAVGHALEALAAGDLTPQYHALAMHYREGGVWDRAARFLYLAGERSVAYAAYADAVMLFDAALEALDREHPRSNPSLELDILLELWTARFEAGSAAKGAAALSERAEAIATSLDDSGRLAKLRLRQAQAGWNMWHEPGAGDTAIEHARQATRLARPDDVRTQSYARFVAGAVQRNLGRFADALSDFDDGLRTFAGSHVSPDGRTLLVLPIQVSLSAWRAETLATLGRFQEAVASGREALRVANDIGHDASRATAAGFLGYVLILRGDPDAAVPILESGLAVAEGVGLGHGIIRNAYPLAYALLLLGRRDEGLRRLARADETRRGASWRETTRFGFLTASAHLHAGELATADEALAQGLTITAARDEQGHVAPLLRLKAEVLAHRGVDPEEELRCRQESLRLATELGMRPETAHAHFGLRRFYRRAGDEARAQASLITALGLFRELEMDWWSREAEASCCPDPIGPRAAP
jgi:DNA-binding SARP family transcriptional activator